jgi:hypothetical protein
MQYTNLSDGLGDNIVSDDFTATRDGIANPSAIVTFEDSQWRLDVEGKNIINANTVPALGDIVMTREPGFGGSVGWRAELLDWAEGETPNAIGLGVYSGPNATGYLWTTGGFIFEDPFWTVHCSPGFEPALGTDFYLAWLWGSLPVSPFTWFDDPFGDVVGDSMTFEGGGDFGTATAGLLAGLTADGDDVISQQGAGLPPIVSPDGWEVIDAGTESASRFYIALESGEQDTLDPSLIIKLPGETIVIPFTWNAGNMRYRSGIITGLRDKLTPFIDYFIYIELTWV